MTQSPQMVSDGKVWADENKGIWQNKTVKKMTELTLPKTGTIDFVSLPKKMSPSIS
jgi:hypothetical protein